MSALCRDEARLVRLDLLVKQARQTIAYKTLETFMFTINQSTLVRGLAALALLTVATVSPSRAQNLQRVDLLLDWTPNTNHLGIYVAQANGYYADAGLDVQIQQPGDGVLADQVVATGKAQFGISYQETFTFSRAEGLPIVSVAAIIQHNTSGFAAIKSQHDLSTPKDLDGLRYGAFGSPVERSIISAMAACEGGQANAVQVIDIGFSDPIPLLTRDRIDFVWLFYGWDGLRAKLNGTELSFLMLSDYQDCVPDYYTPILTTSEKLIAEQPDLVRAFVTATAQGYTDAIRDPETAAAVLLAAAPDLDPALVTESAKYLADQFQSDAPRWGEQKQAIWEQFTAFMIENNVLSKPVSIESAFTNEFLPPVEETATETISSTP